MEGRKVNSNRDSFLITVVTNEMKRGKKGVTSVNSETGVKISTDFNLKVAEMWCEK